MEQKGIRIPGYDRCGHMRAAVWTELVWQDLPLSVLSHRLSQNGAAEGKLIRELLCRSAPRVAMVESAHARE
jgi:hypothetical protein